MNLHFLETALAYLTKTLESWLLLNGLLFFFSFFNKLFDHF